jgi:uncharacterized RDD family membrane protein YckC
VALAFTAYVVTSTLQSDRANKLVLIALYLSMPAYFLSEVAGRRSFAKRFAGIIISKYDGRTPPMAQRWVRWAIKSSIWLLPLLLSFVPNRWIPDSRISNYVWLAFPDKVESLVDNVGGRVASLPGMRWFEWPFSGILHKSKNNQVDVYSAASAARRKRSFLPAIASDAAGSLEWYSCDSLVICFTAERL